ncbi:RNA-directed DNA polymerase, eukaryota, reverse transcriptase zinc-binding domain protein [Tanacetum coccineum]
MMRNKFFIGGDEGEKKLTWVKWKKCLASKDLGGLGVGSIFGLNLGLLFKWLWRFRCHSNDLWANVIISLYGSNGGINEERVHTHGSWGVILSSVNRLKHIGIDLLALCNRKIECTVSSRLNGCEWSSALRRPPRGGVELLQFNGLMSSIEEVALSDHKDSWLRSLNSSNEYTVASVRALVDANTLVVDTTATRWNCNVPIKVNVFLWRLALNKIPSKLNLDRIGIDVDSTLCSICGEDVKTVNHIFFSCEMAKDLWALLAKWWSLDIPICSNFSEWSSWLDSLHLSSKKKLFLDGVSGTLLWSIWNFRNRLLFTVPPPKKTVLWDNIVSQSFLWISSRNPKLNFSWVGWIQHSLVSIASM